MFRGSEYNRFLWASNKEPLTYYDMNLSAQDHQTYFTCDSDAGKPEYESQFRLDLITFVNFRTVILAALFQQP